MFLARVIDDIYFFIFGYRSIIGKDCAREIELWDDRGYLSTYKEDILCKDLDIVELSNKYMDGPVFKLVKIGFIFMFMYLFYVCKKEEGERLQKIRDEEEKRLKEEEKRFKELKLELENSNDDNFDKDIYYLECTNKGIDKDHIFNQSNIPKYIKKSHFDKFGELINNDIRILLNDDYCYQQYRIKKYVL